MALALVGIGVIAGRLSVSTRAAYDSGRLAGYVQGEREGEAQGIREGRALQQPVPTASAFDAGYVAGANDVFGGYDGGWPPGSVYIITLGPGGTGITYRIASRVILQPGVDYYLCADQRSICQESRR
jgi:hypothetical protein